MSRKDYEKFARHIKQLNDATGTYSDAQLRTRMRREVRYAAIVAASVFEEDNPTKFDRQRFLTACGVE